VRCGRYDEGSTDDGVLTSEIVAELQDLSKGALIVARSKTGADVFGSFGGRPAGRWKHGETMADTC
jgi:hypothetical protein